MAANYGVKGPHEKLMQRFDAAWSERDMWFHRWDACFELVVPERSKRYRTSKGGTVAPFVHDSTATENAEDLANNMMSALMPSGVPWLLLAPGPTVTDPEVRLKNQILLEPINLLIAHHIQRSKLPLATQPAFLDMLVTAGAVKIEPNDEADSVRVECIPIDELAYECSRDNEINHIYRKYKSKGFAILDKYGDAVPAEVRQRIEEFPFEELEMRMALEPDGKKFKYCEILMASDKPVYLVDKAFKRNPIVIFRWSTTAGTAYGRGPGLIKFPDIQNLNTLMGFSLKAGAMDLAGVWGIEDDGVVNPYTAQIVPGAKIVMSSVSLANPSMRRLDEQSMGRFNIGTSTLEDLRESIRRAFFADKFSPIEGDKMSATEILKRAQDLSQTLGAVWGRLEAELLRPIASLYLEILKDIGVFDEFGDDVVEMLKIDSKSLDVMFLGTLAQAQRLENVQGLFQYLAFHQQTAQFDPEVSILVDLVGAMLTAAEGMGVQPRLLRNKEQRQEIYAKMQEGAAAAQAAATDDQGQPLTAE